MRMTPYLVGFLGLGLVPLVGGEELARKPLPAAAVEHWIEQLGSVDFRAREEAAKALEVFGVDALPVLRQALAHPDAEVRRRLEELVPRLETAALLAPKRVSLNLKQRPIREAVAELARQTGYKLTLWPEAQANGQREQQVFSFEFTNLPFWEALDRLAETGGLNLEQHHGEDGLRLHFQDNYAPFIYRTGPFRVVAQGFNYNRSNHFGSLPKNPGQGSRQSSEYLSCNLSITVEPKLPLLGVGELRLIAAFDDQQHSMLPSSQSGDRPVRFGGPRYYRYGGYRSYSQQVQVNLIWPTKSSQTVRYVKGVIPVTLLAEQKPLFVVENILAAKGKKLQEGNTSLDVDEVKEEPNGPGGKSYHLKLSVRETRKDNPNDYSWVNSLYQRLELQDAQGRKYGSRGMNWHHNTPTSVQGTFMFGNPGNGELGPPAKLVYFSWVTLDHEVPFEFKDLPLP
jgi:hypothetical protein